MALDPSWNPVEARNDESDSEAENWDNAPDSPLAKPTIRGFSHGMLNLSDSLHYVDREKRYYPQSSRAYGPNGGKLEGSNHEDRRYFADSRGRKAKQDLTSSSRQRLSDSFGQTSSTPDRHEGEDSKATSERRGGDIHVSNPEQGKDGAKERSQNQLIKVIRTPLLVDEPDYLQITDIQCYHRDPPTPNAEERTETFVQAPNHSNLKGQMGQSKPNQCSESEAADCLDHQQPEIRTKSPDNLTSESAADFSYPEPSLAGHARDQLISPLDGRESLLANQDVTKTDRSECAEDMMQNIRCRVLGAWKTRQSAGLETEPKKRRFFGLGGSASSKDAGKGGGSAISQHGLGRSMLVRRKEQVDHHAEIYLTIPCNVREFMEKQFAGSNKNLRRVITLSGTATCGQATTCSDYISSNWPLRGPWILGILQDTIGGAKRNAEGNWSLSVRVALHVS